MNVVKLLFCLFLSQFIVGGVFGLPEDTYYVINQQQNLCGDFIRGDATQANWLPDNWEAVFLYSNIEKKFLENISCLDGNTGICCKQQGFRYAGVPIGVEFVSDERKGAEILASKKIIQAKTFNPHEYKLEENISRKEIMKIVMNTSGIEVQDTCREIFTDVESDWGCKYIESALENNFITGNDLFRPNDSVTKTEALKLIFKARDIEKAYTTDYWQEDYVSTAYYYGYIKEKYKNYNELATRGWIFSLSGKTFPEFSKY